MSAILQEIREKIKVLVNDPQAFSAILLVLVALTSFGLGRQSVREVVPDAVAGGVESGEEVRPISVTSPSEDSNATTFYVASRNGEVYHLPHCSGAKRISEANKITFKTKAEAEAAGYRPAVNCKGI